MFVVILPLYMYLHYMYILNHSFFSVEHMYFILKLIVKEYVQFSVETVISYIDILCNMYYVKEEVGQ